MLIACAVAIEIDEASAGSSRQLRSLITAHNCVTTHNNPPHPIILLHLCVKCFLHYYCGRLLHVCVMCYYIFVGVITLVVIISLEGKCVHFLKQYLNSIFIVIIQKR